MSVSDSNRVQLAYIAETSFGVQKTGSNLQILRHTGETLKQDTSIQVSNEIRSDRQVADVARTSIGVSGQINAELSYGSYDDLLLAALMGSTWSTVVTVTASTISASSVDNSFNDSANGFTNLVAGQWIKVSGFTTTGNNGYFKIVSKTNAKIVVSGGTLTTEAAGNSVTIKMGAQVTNGTTKTSFNIERTYADLSNELSLFLGCMVNTFNLNFSLGQMLTGNFGFIGKTEQSKTTSGGSGYTAAGSNSVLNAIDNIASILEAQASSHEVLAFTLALNNNLRARQKLGNLGAFDIGVGEVNVSGSFEAYFASKTLYDKYLNFTSTSLATIATDGAGNSYIIDLPSVKLTDGSREAGGKNQDIIAKLNWQAFRNSTENVTVRIAKFPIA